MAEDERRIWLEEAMNRWETSLLRLCFAYLADRNLAEDAVQETFLKAWKGYDRFRKEADEKTWLTRIAINTAKDMRKSAWFRHVDRSAALDSLPDGSVPFEAQDDTITRAVMALPGKLRQVSLLCWLQGFSGYEAARVLHVPRSTVYHRLKKAQELLKQKLEGYDET
ncbi:MAG: sigma-70 family RNA polymerase sigma factor [Clostridia bacterium]|nr:sigma-70 family RNA polymerase sigma factor [Clostridia bacterium]